MVSCAAYLEITKISIHAPARGATSLFKVGKTSNALFQSTPPARGATAPLHHGHAALGISIHAPPRGGRLNCQPQRFLRIDFNPRPPRGGRLWRDAVDAKSLMISIHAPREGGDCLILWTRRCRRYFNPRPPRGGRPKINRYNVYNKGFQSTPPARGATILSAPIL